MTLAGAGRDPEGATLSFAWRQAGGVVDVPLHDQEPGHAPGADPCPGIANA